jgi:hypothetical protein
MAELLSSFSRRALQQRARFSGWSSVVRGNRCRGKPALRTVIVAWLSRAHRGAIYSPYDIRRGDIGFGFEGRIARSLGIQGQLRFARRAATASTRLPLILRASSSFGYIQRVCRRLRFNSCAALTVGNLGCRPFSSKWAGRPSSAVSASICMPSKLLETEQLYDLWARNCFTPASKSFRSGLGLFMGLVGLVIGPVCSIRQIAFIVGTRRPDSSALGSGTMWDAACGRSSLDLRNRWVVVLAAPWPASSG